MQGLALNPVVSCMQVLIDPMKRQVYDIYGKQGLRSGLEVGEHLNTAEDIKKQWEKFQAQQVG